MQATRHASGEGAIDATVPLTRPPLRSADLSPEGRGTGEPHAWAGACLFAATVFLAACQSTPTGYVLLHANEDPLDVAERIADYVGDCWFDGDSAFDGFSYAPELSSPERPRVLIVEEADPTGLPQLVIEIERAKRGSDIKLFGPLMDSGRADRIRHDVSFWAGGGRTCR